MLVDYRKHVAERAAVGVPPLPLTAKQVAEIGRASCRERVSSPV